MSEQRKAPRGLADPRVVAWSNAQPTTTLFVSSITLFELECGVCLAARRDPEQGRLLRRWLEERFLPAFAKRILPVTTEIARRCGALHVPDPRPELDSLIAATALVHGLTVVTRNVADFAPMGVPVLNPWEA